MNNINARLALRFIDFLAQKGALQGFFKNFNVGSMTVSEFLEAEVRNEPIKAAFIWCYAKEGGEYWQRLNEEWGARWRYELEALEMEEDIL